MQKISLDNNSVKILLNDNYYRTKYCCVETRFCSTAYMKIALHSYRCGHNLVLRPTNKAELNGEPIPLGWASQSEARAMSECARLFVTRYDPVLVAVWMIPSSQREVHYFNNKWQRIDYGADAIRVSCYCHKQRFIVITMRKYRSYLMFQYFQFVPYSDQTSAQEISKINYLHS